jgi:hypothetical protein
MNQFFLKRGTIMNRSLSFAGMAIESGNADLPANRKKMMIPVLNDQSTLDIWDQFK